MPGPHSHTNPPSVFTQWPSQEELKHSSMSGKRENALAQTPLNVAGLHGENLPHKDLVPHTRPALSKVKPPPDSRKKEEAEGPGPSFLTHTDQMTERMAETEPFPMAPPAGQPQRAKGSRQEG